MNWIDVINDRMPDHNGVVICCNANDEDSPICLGFQSRDGDTQFYIFEINQEPDKVTHWMELPQKPKSELTADETNELIKRK